MYSEDLKSIKASLIWLKEDDLNLMVFYQTKKGETGSVYSPNIPGGNFGDLEEFPHIACGESGIDDEPSEVVFYDKININKLAPFSKVYFVATDYAKLVLKKQINFNEYQGTLKLNPRYNVQREDRYTIRLTSEEKGDFLVIGEIEIGESIYMLKNINKAMTLEEFREKIPGAKKVTF